MKTGPSIVMPTWEDLVASLKIHTQLGYAVCVSTTYHSDPEYFVVELGKGVDEDFMKKVKWFTGKEQGTQALLEGLSGSPTPTPPPVKQTPVIEPKTADISIKKARVSKNKKGQ